MIFMWVPDGVVNHSWFYIQERPDLFLGRTDFLMVNRPNIGRFLLILEECEKALYFDISDVVEKNPVKTTVTDTAI